jgi:5-methylcytosine-specific restriction protein A
MSWGFEKGRVYNRRRDIHARFGGQQQGGIITPAEHPVVIIITGEEGLQHGYADQFRPDGVFEYFGEGQVGDMRIRAGNKAIAGHSEDGKGLLLFRKTRDGLRFEGEMVCEGFRYQSALDREGHERTAIVFELRSLDSVVEAAAERSIAVVNMDLDELRQLALLAASMATQPPSEVRRNIYQRSQDVRTYVLARADGVCEGCGAPAPFLRSDGTPYLEPHHLRRVSDGGQDHPQYVIALCPNCHRRVHAGIDGDRYNAELGNRMLIVEPAGGSHDSP